MCDYIHRIESFPSLQKMFSPCQSGTMIPLFNSGTDKDFRVEYIYSGTIFPETTKGPYQHTIRAGKLALLSGEMLVVHKSLDSNKFCEDYLTPMTLIELPTNEQYCLIGLGKQVGVFINMCNFAWQPGNNETIVPDFSGYDFRQWGIH